MQRVPVESSSIASIGYAPQERVLELEFPQSGEVYQYFDVPAEEYAALLAADSKGTYVNQQLKPRGISLPAAPVLIEIASHSYPHPVLASVHSLFTWIIRLNSSGRCQYGLDRTRTKGLRYVVPRQEVMTHIEVIDDNSTPEQNMVRADRVELSQAS
jgi:hypothetical protein